VQVTFAGGKGSMLTVIGVTKGNHTYRCFMITNRSSSCELETSCSLLTMMQLHM